MATYFRNPANGYTEKATTGWTWLWAFLFGPFYLLYKGAWPHALVFAAIFLYLTANPPMRYRNDALAVVIAELMVWLPLAIIYSVLAGRIIRRRYLRKGWIEAAQHGSRTPPPIAPLQASAAIWHHDDRTL